MQHRRGDGQMKVAAIGRGAMLYNTVAKLGNVGHKITSVITFSPQPEYGRRENDFRKIAKRMRAPFLLGVKLGSQKVLRLLKGSDIAVSVNCPYMFSAEIIGCFKIGILNAHLGDLPSYRGNAAPNWAIINGEKEITVSIHLVEPLKLDCGRVIAQSRLAINNFTYIGDIYKWAEDVVPELFCEALLKLCSDSSYALKYADINAPESLRCYPRVPEDSRINWSSSAEDIHRLIRASSKPFEGAYGFVEDKKIIIWRAEINRDNERYYAVPGQISQVSPDYFVVITGEGKLRITSWQCRNKIRSIRQRLQ